MLPPFGTISSLVNIQKVPVTHGKCNATLSEIKGQMLRNLQIQGQYSYLLSKSSSGAPKSQSNQILLDAATQHKNPERKLKKQIKPTPTARLVLSMPPCPATRQCLSLYHNRRIRFKSRNQPAFLYLLLRYEAVANTQNSQVIQEQATQSTKQTTKRGV